MNKKKIYPSYFIWGALIIYGVLFVIPGIIGIAYSFTDWSAYSDKINFVGFDNFKVIFSGNENYMKILGNTLWFTIITTILKNAIGLLLAVLLTKSIKFLNFHRGVMFMPSVLSTLIIGMIFTSILDPKIGILNVFLRGIGLDTLAKQWLTSPQFAFGSVVAVDVWRGIGYIMTIFIAGILSISSEYYEAANIDGATGLQKFRFITFPLILPTLATTTVLNVIYGLKVFDMIYVLTNGGPGKSTTEVLYTIVFKKFGMGQYAIGTALSSVMFVIMVFIGVFMIKIMTKNEVME
ncbi:MULTISPECIES: carbohydrate ABC transporter permease [Clostridium]|uniref:Sugar ABC transporter permease n=2 Tax=Clostridium TaxID=1485 RepID=A0AAV3W258_9CLOT|nr:MULTISPECIES: sugar ABC transporter permease [Clostridium]AVK47704.1 ABC transporter permease [Clostridium sp. MF28]NOW05325.1 raffinose/stachyose/melibiose transport system permease protein [Clostridium beijerinckii]NRT73006.1 raffinose/stachyose/melibiose transport system permease protein [Clostridium beijerinckii]NRT80011.1 raffinose/stachyose/melibiose transport system permease protein [Clostridium beijerinckii]NSB13642.1 raffinose/stachyose/melibiose transport system permease protein [